MKHVLLIRFLLLFNAWWISWNVVVHANENYSSSFIEPRTSASGLNKTEPVLRTTISEQHLNHTKRIVVVYTSEDRSEGQYSENVTSEKPVNKAKDVTSERSLSSVTGNVGEHSSMTTEQQESKGSGMKTNERNSTFESLNNRSISIGEGVTSSAYAMDVSSVSKMNYSEPNNRTVLTVDHVSENKTRFERSVDQNVTNHVTGATSANENKTFAEDQAKTSAVSMGSTVQTSFIHSQSTIPTTSFPLEGHRIVVVYTSEDRSEGQSSENVTSEKPVNKTKDVTSERSLSSVTGNVGGNTSMTTKRQENSEMKTNERKNTFESLNNQSISIGKVVSSYSMDVSSVSRMNYSEQNNHTAITADHVSDSKGRFERSVDQNVTNHVTGATSTNENKTFAEDQAKTSAVSMGSTVQTSLLHSQSTIPSTLLHSQSTIPATSFPLEGHRIVVVYTSEDRSEGQSSENVTSEKPVNKTKDATSERSLSSVTGNVGGHSSMTTARQENNYSGMKTNERKNAFEPLSNQSISNGEVVTSSAYSMDVSSVSKMNDSEQNNHTVITVDHVSENKTRFERSVDQNVTNHVTGVTSASEENNAVTEDLAKTSDVSMESTAQTSLLHSQSTIPTALFRVEGRTIVVVYTSEDQSEGQQSSEQVTSGKPGDKVIDLSGVTGNIGGHFNVTTEQQENNDSGMKTNERKSNGGVTSTAAYSMDVSSVLTMNYSEQNDHATVTGDYISTTTSRLETSLEEEATMQVTVATSASEENNAVTEDLAKTSDVSMESTAQTSLLHSQSTILTTPFPLEDLLAPTNITSVNVTDKSVTLRWCQGGLVTNLSVTVVDLHLVDQQHRCLGKTSNESISRESEFCNWTWMSYVIPPDRLTSGATYNSTIRVCILDRCENASHTFQTAPAQPADLKTFKVDTQRINMSWSQKRTVDKFDIWVSDPLAKVSWNRDNKTEMMTVWGSIDQLSTPGQLLTVTITALSCHLRSKNLTKHFNTKPSRPGPLDMFDCYDNNLCIQWNQSGIFDSYVIRVNGSGASISCSNSSDATKNLTTVNCTTHHFVPFGSSTALSVAVKSGSEMSDEVMEVYMKKPAKPEDIHVMRLSASTVCFSWNQSGSYDEFDIRISLSNHSYIYEENWIIAMNNDGLMLTWCVNELPCPGAMYSLLIATVSHGKKSDFQNMPFRSAVDYLVTSASHTNESLELSIQPDFGNDSCPSFEDVERIVYTYQPVNNESCSSQSDINAVYNATRDITTVSGLIAGVTYQMKVWAVIDGIKNKEHVIHCTTKPNPPSDLIVDVFSTYMILTWTPPKGCIAGFLVECIGQNNSLNYSKTVKEANATCENLTPGSRYSVTVRSQLRDNTSSESESLEFVTEPAKPEGVHVTSSNTSTVCFSWNQFGSYDGFDIQISLLNHSDIYQENWTIPVYSDSLMLMWCVNELPCPGAVYILRIVAVSQEKKSDIQNLPFRSAVDYAVKCMSQTTESLELFIQPDIGNESCPSFEDVERIVYKYQPVDNESCSSQSNINAVFNATRDITIVSGLIAGVNYQMKLWAVIDSFKSKEQVIDCTTKPNPPSGLRILNASRMMLIWTSPEGCVADFLVDCIGQYGALNDSKVVKEVNVTWESLTPGALYNAMVRSRLRDNTSSEAESLQFVTVPMSPSKVRVEKTFVDSFNLLVEYNTEWKCTHFHFKGDGIKSDTIPCRNRIHRLTLPKSNTCYNISVSTISNYSGNVPKEQTSMDSILVSNWTLPRAVSNLSIASSTVNSLTLEWIQPDESIRGIHGYNLMIWNGSEYPQNISLSCNSNVLNCTNPAMTYELKNLTPSTNYTIAIWAVNMGGDSAKQVIMKQTHDHIPVPEFSLALVGIVASVAVTFVLTLFVLVFVLRKKTKFAVPSARRPSDGMGFQNPTFTPDICESMKPKPIPLNDFIEHLDELHNDSDLRFSSEYALLTELSPKHPQTAAEMEENRTKNRYSNILPFDHSRVKLIPLDDDDQGSDYINANFMPGYVSKREFIAAQGPMKSTVDDFWRMIWEQNVSTIVMVTNLQERGREKCAEYWPMDDEPVFYGDLQVQMKSESQLNYYIIRILDIKLGEKKRVIKHLHFISWPDFGCPENTAVLLDFVLGVRAHAPSQPLQGSGPILVHCSAGVGRTGTFILVDHLLQRMRNHRSLDIFSIVLDMRSYRCNMLQTEAQYVFAHECIKTSIERQMISNMTNSIAEDEDEECMYQNAGEKEKLEEEEECVYQNCTKENVKGFPV